MKSEALLRNLQNTDTAITEGERRDHGLHWMDETMAWNVKEPGWTDCDADLWKPSSDR